MADKEIKIEGYDYDGDRHVDVTIQLRPDGLFIGDVYGEVLVSWRNLIAFLRTAQQENDNG